MYTEKDPLDVMISFIESLTDEIVIAGVVYCTISMMYILNVAVGMRFSITCC